MVDNGENFEPCYRANPQPNGDDITVIVIGIYHVSVGIVGSVIGGLAVVLRDHKQCRIGQKSWKRQSSAGYSSTTKAPRIKVSI